MPKVLLTNNICSAFLSPPFRYFLSLDSLAIMLSNVSLKVNEKKSLPASMTMLKESKYSKGRPPNFYPIYQKKQLQQLQQQQ